MVALTGKAAKVKVTSASYSTAAGEAFTSLSATTDRTEFRITDGTKRHWTQAVPPVVLVNSTAHTDFVYNPVQGKLTFTGTPLTTAESAQVTATVYWVTASYLPWTREWSADFDTDMSDITSFSTTASDVQWRTYTPGLSGGSIDLGRIVAGPSTAVPQFFDRLNVGQDVITELSVVASGTTYKVEAYAQVADVGYQTDIASEVTESVTLQVTGQMFYATTE